MLSMHVAVCGDWKRENYTRDDLDNGGNANARKTKGPPRVTLFWDDESQWESKGEPEASKARWARDTFCFVYTRLILTELHWTGDQSCQRSVLI